MKFNFHIKKLDKFIVKSFTQILCATFLICLFIFIMQFLWRWVDDFAGKGLDFTILAKFFFLSSISLVGQALPLAILLAALMTFGNFGERLELLAMKAAGIPLLRIMRPLIIECILLGFISLYFQNVIGPKAQQKLYTLLYSIKETSLEMEIPEKAFCDRIEGYNFYVDRKNKETGMLYDVKIYDITSGFDKSTIIVADSAHIDYSEDETYILLSLYNGELFGSSSNDFADPGNNNKRGSNNSRYMRQSFENKIIAIPYDGGFKMQDEAALNTQAASKDMKQLETSIDTLTKRNDSIGYNNYLGLVRTQYTLTNKLKSTDSLNMKRDNIYHLSVDSTYNSAKMVQKLRWKKTVQNRINQLYTDFEIKHKIMEGLDKDLNKHKLLWWEKITLSVGCLIFFFIGSPLGAIVRKGGLGYPVLISVATFVIYYIFDSAGYKMARIGEWEIWIGRWLSSFVLIPIGIILTYQANRDSTIFNADAYKEFFRKLFGIKEKRHIPLKEVIIDDPDYAANMEMLKSISHRSHQYHKSEKLKRIPSLKKIFFYNTKDNRMENINNDLEALVEEMSNSRSKKIIIQLNELPILRYKSVKSPFKNKIINIFTLLFFPIGIFFYIRSYKYRIELLKDLIKIEKTAKEIEKIIEKEKLI